MGFRATAVKVLHTVLWSYSPSKNFISNSQNRLLDKCGRPRFGSILFHNRGLSMTEVLLLKLLVHLQNLKCHWLLYVDMLTFIVLVEL